MDQSLDETVEIRLPKSDCLLLFELLTRSYKVWRETNSNDAAADPMIVEARELCDRKVLWHLEGALERTMVEIFWPNYHDLLSRAKERVEAQA
jgi:hypothetical protein